MRIGAALAGSANRSHSFNRGSRRRLERRAKAQERRVVPETIARFIKDASEYVSLTLKFVAGLSHTFEPGKTPSALKRYESQPDWKLPSLANKYPRCSTDRDTAEKNNLEWVTPGHPLFEAIRRDISSRSQATFSKGACFYSLQHAAASRLDFYRARVVDGLGQVTHERLFAVEVTEKAEARLVDPSFSAPWGQSRFGACPERSRLLWDPLPRDYR
jgi:hypothetical protein